LIMNWICRTSMGTTTTMRPAPRLRRHRAPVDSSQATIPTPQGVGDHG
jgi:hypothetical protein